MAHFDMCINIFEGICVMQCSCINLVVPVGAGRDDWDLPSDQRLAGYRIFYLFVCMMSVQDALAEKDVADAE